MSKPIVIALGEILWDMLPTGKRAGGAPVNFAYHASQNGAESYAISAVGNDELGAELLNDAHKAGINTLVQTNEYPTGRLWRDAKLYEIGAGTSEIRRMLIGRELFAETM